MFVRHPFLFHHGLGIFAWLFFALLVVAVVVGVIALFRRPWAYHPNRVPPSSWSYEGYGQRNDPALAELRVRYARGEITWDDYVQRARNLGYPVAPPSGPDAGPGPWVGPSQPPAPPTPPASP